MCKSLYCAQAIMHVNLLYAQDFIHTSYYTSFHFACTIYYTYCVHTSYYILCPSHSACYFLVPLYMILYKSLYCARKLLYLLLTCMHKLLYILFCAHKLLYKFLYCAQKFYMLLSCDHKTINLCAQDFLFFFNYLSGLYRLHSFQNKIKSQTQNCTSEHIILYTTLMLCTSVLLKVG